MPTYTLDLSTILAIFLDQKRTGELRAEDVRIRHKAGLQASIVFYAGKDVSYRIVSRKGQLFAEGEMAKQLLTHVGLIQWNWFPQEEKRTHISSALPRSEEFSSVFRQSQQGLREVAGLPRAYQRLFMLVDGQRTVDQIALFFPGNDVQEIYRALVEMYRYGWLVLTT